MTQFFYSAELIVLSKYGFCQHIQLRTQDVPRRHKSTWHWPTYQLTL